MSSHETEYRVSKLDRTTPLKSAGGYSATFTNVFIGPRKSLMPFVNCFRDKSIDIME